LVTVAIALGSDRKERQCRQAKDNKQYTNAFHDLSWPKRSWIWNCTPPTGKNRTQSGTARITRS